MRDISETRMEVYSRDDWSCRRCGAPNGGQLTMAHGISKGVLGRKILMNELGCSQKEAALLIHHPANLFTACAGECNDHYDVTYNPVACKRIADAIAENETDNYFIDEYIGAKSE